MSAKYFSMSALLRRHSERIAHSERKAIQDDTWEPNERKAIQDDTFRVIRDGSRARIEGRTYSGEWESICDTPHGSDFTDEELIRYFLVKDQVFDAETGNLCRSRKIAEQVRRLP